MRVIISKYVDSVKNHADYLDILRKDTGWSLKKKTSYAFGI